MVFLMGFSFFMMITRIPCISFFEWELNKEGFELNFLIKSVTVVGFLNKHFLTISSIDASALQIKKLVVI